MSLNLIGLVIGLFIVPAWLLLEGHGLRRRSKRTRRVFWGGVLGHTIGIAPMTMAAIMPAELWGADDPLRVFLVYWALVAGTLLGVLIGFLRPVRGVGA